MSHLQFSFILLPKSSCFHEWYWLLLDSSNLQLHFLPPTILLTSSSRASPPDTTYWGPIWKEGQPWYVRYSHTSPQKKVAKSCHIWSFTVESWTNKANGCRLRIHAYPLQSQIFTCSDRGYLRYETGPMDPFWRCEHLVMASTRSISDGMKSAVLAPLHIIM